MASEIRAIIFDLDGTLYFNDGFAEEIKWGAAIYIADLKGISADTAATLIRETRKRLSCEKDQEATLSMVCIELGGSVAGFHAAVTPLLHPEKDLKPDCRITTLLTVLAERFDLYLYTNNNRSLTDRILRTIELSEMFEKIFTIEDFWRPKPDRKVLNNIFSTIRKNPEECLFVGDRYDVDLKLAVEMGCTPFLVTDIQDLMGLETFLSLSTHE